ncbi:sushi, von Willebrand factor type A, EGF and pentraxin domain-containing protein 1 [Narcine bancroftii]|uniref:sushi, von Willebrand factor type A, EGF and pentraxin domain-containing protein 1 n=1 Tax=Narcine bancroftii TaxID=1343680 RepID=UPI003831D89A
MMRGERGKCERGNGSRAAHLLLLYAGILHAGVPPLHAKPKVPNFDVCLTCHVNATCITKSGTRICTCNYGFSGNGINICSDKNECQMGAKKICGVHAVCYNTHGSYYCTCNEGYRSSNNMDSFTPNDGTHCIAVNCHSPPVLKNTVRYLPETTTYGSTVQYQCLAGHVGVSGNNSLICSAQGYWEGSTLVCEAVDCGSPPELRNTVRDPQVVTIYGSVVQYQCLTGHVHVRGNGTSVCSAQGQWEGPDLVCEVVRCGSPPELRNIVRDPQVVTIYGSVVEYQCLTGHVHVRGNGTSICSAQGQWEGPDLVCEAVDCGSPPELWNATRDPLNFTTYGSVVEYQCLTGHVHVRGNGTSVCSAQGQWEGPDLVCEAVDCGSPPELWNATRDLLKATNYGSVVEYQCLTGHVYVRGNGSSVCSAQGQWEGPDLVCEAVDCGSPPELWNATRDLLKATNYGSVVEYQCLTGHVHVRGNSTSVCSAQGQWEGPDLVCEAVDCGSPPELRNAMRDSLNFTTYGRVVEYQCLTGHVRVRGNSTSICSAQGQWERPVLVCEAVDCGSPPELWNATRDPLNVTTYGSVVEYQCLTGHVYVRGNGTSVCSAQGRWEGPDLVCEAVDCSSPPELRNAMRDALNITTYGIVVEYQCLTGHVYVRGNGTSVCSAQGQWEGPDLVCEAVDCGSPPELRNAMRDALNITTYGIVVEYQCLTGHVYVRGNGTSVCSAQGRWEGPDLVCEAVDCGSPPELRNAMRDAVNLTTYGSVVEYQCLMGHVRVRGNGTSVCSAQGQWEGPDLVCEAVDCGMPPMLQNTVPHPFKGTTYGSIVMYQCLVGYMHVGGSDKSFCSAQGRWEGGNLKCEAVDCGIPVPVQNAWSSPTSQTTYGAEIQYHCKTGFVNGGGNGTMICSERGQWEGAQINCSGYFVNGGGNGTMICSERGQWEGAQINCSEIDCEIPPEVPHAKLAWYKSTRLGSVVHYNCRDGFYAVSGSNVSKCKQDGQWEEVTLVCQVKEFILFNESCLKWKRDGVGTRYDDTYLFQIQGQRAYQSKFFYKESLTYRTADDSPAICLKLQPGTNYTVNITHPASQYSAYIHISMAVTDPPVPDVQFMIVERIRPLLFLPKVESRNGPISLYQVIVLPLNLQHSFNCNSQNIRDFFGHQKDTEAYITAEFIAMDVKDGIQFSVGDRLYYRGFYNAALETGKNHFFLLKTVSEWNYVKKQSCVILAQWKGLSNIMQTVIFLGLGSLGMIGFLLFLCYSVAWSFKVR